MTKSKHCKEPGCKDPVRAKGLCGYHYGQVWRNGATHERAPTMNPDAHLHIRVDDATIKAIATLRKLWKCTASDAIRKAIGLAVKS